MKSRNKKIVLVFLLLLVIGIGYAAVNTTLKINGSSTFSANNWLIYFDNVREKEGSVIPETPAYITNAEKTNIQFDVTLDKPGDFYDFDVYIKNDGSIDAMIDEVTMTGLTEEQKEYMSFVFTYTDGTKVRKCDILPAHGQREVHVRVEYLFEGDFTIVPEEGDSSHFDISITYVQDGECELDEIDVSIDPNGGIYNNTNELTTVTLSDGQTYTVGVPTREAYTFAGWEEVSDTDSFADNVVTFNGKNVRLKAKWEVSDDVVARIDREESVYYLSIQAAINDARNNETIYLLKNTEEEFTNNKNVTINLQGYKVTGSGLNQAGYSLTLINGSIENTNGIGFINNGTLTLGINDENLCDADPAKNTECAYEDGFVSLIGTTFGLKTIGTTNFYDGFIEGETAIVGIISETPIDEITGDGITKYYEVVIGKDRVKEDQKAYLSNKITNAVSKTIVGGNIYYLDLSDNFRTSEVTGYTIYAIRDFEGAYPLSVGEGKTVEFDIAGYTVDLGNDINVNGTLKLTDSATEKGALNMSHTINLSGDLEIDNMTVNGTSSTNDLIRTTNTSTIDVKNSTINNTQGYIFNNTGDLTVDLDDSSYVSGQGYIIYTDGTNLTLNGGDYTSTKDRAIILRHYNGDITLSGVNMHLDKNTYDEMIESNEKGTILVENSTISAFDLDNSTFYCNYDNSHKAKVIINNSNINGKMSGCDVTMNSGSITGKYNAVYSGILTLNDGVIQNTEGTTGNNSVVSDADVTINGGLIENKQSGYNSKCINQSNIVMTGGKLKSADRGFYAFKYDHTQLMTGGIIETKNESIYCDSSAACQFTIIGGTVKSSDSYAIYINSGTVTLGTNDENISKETPVIIGNTYAVYNVGGNFKFFDGILKGNTAGRSGLVNEMPDGAILVENETEAIPESENYYNIAYVKPGTNFLRVGENEYNSFNKLLSTEDNNNLEIDVIENGTIVSPVTITSDKIVTINLNGHTLTTTQTINNEGTLTINDELVTENGEQVYKGTINNTVGSAFYTTGPLILNGGNYITSKQAGGEVRFINVNNTTLIMNNVGINKTITEDDDYYSSIIYLDNSSIGNFTNVNIDAKRTYGVECYNSTLSLTNTDIYAHEKAIYNCNTTLESGNISGVNYVIQNGNLTMNGGKVYTTESDSLSYTIYNVKNVTINDGLIENNGLVQQYDYYYVSQALSECEYVTINGGTIKSKSVAVCNAYDLTMNAGTVDGGYAGIYGSLWNKRSCTQRVKGGTVKGGTYGIKHRNDTLIIGEDDNNLSTTSPEIIGGQYGYYKMNGSVYFYDGVLKGKVDSRYGNIDKQPDGTVLSEDGTDTIDDEVYQTTYLGNQSNFLQVGEHTYNSFNKVFDNEDALDITIDVIANGNIAAAQIIPAGRNVVLNLNGYTINLKQGLTLNSSFTINDTLVTENGEQIYKGYMIMQSGTLFYINEELTINGGNYIVTDYLDYYDKLIVLDSATFNFNDGTISRPNAYDSGNGYARIISTNNYNNIINIYGGKIIDNSRSGDGTIRCDGGGKVTIKDAFIDSNKNAIVYCETTMQSGLISAGGNAIAGGSATINGGKIYLKTNENYISAISGSTVTMNGGEVEVDCDENITAYAFNNSKLTMNGGTIKSSDIGIYSPNGSIINDGTIIGGNIGIVSNGYLTILGGEITGGTYGVNITSSTTTIGNNDETISITTPEIIGGTYGIYKTGGTFNFYDGIAKGLVGGIEGLINTIADNSYMATGGEQKVVEGETLNYITNYLGDEYLFITNTTKSRSYKNIYTALSEADDNDEFEMTESISFFNEINIDKSITIDMKGNNIVLNQGIKIPSGKEVTFMNKDTTKQSKLSSLLDISIFTNNGTLTLDNVYIENTNTSKYQVVNNSTATLNKVNINSKYGIDNEDSATVTNCTVTSVYYCINNAGTLTLTGGNYTTTDSYYFLRNTSTGTATVSGVTSNSGIDNAGEINLTTSTISKRTWNNGTLIIDKSNIVDDGGDIGFVLYNEGTLEIEDSEADVKNINNCHRCGYSIFGNSSTGIFKVKNTDFILENNSTNHSAVFGQYSSGQMKLENINVTSNNTTAGSYKTLNITNGVANIDNVKSTLTYPGTTSYGIYISDNATVNVNNSEFTINSKNAYGSYIDSGTLNLTSVNNQLKAIGTNNAYGTYLNGANSLIVLGERDGLTINADVSTTSPLISGVGTNEGYGIYNNNGSYHLFDGKLIGSTKARSNKATEWEYLWEAHDYVDEETGYEYCILEYLGE